eukprot:362156-Chlamydomonas_euryale.AAC.22
MRRAQVTLVDQSDCFTYKPLLYELINGSANKEEVAPYFNQLLAPYPIRFVQGKVVGIEEESGSDVEVSGKVQLEGGTSLDYDYLVMGLGSQTDTRGIPGVKDYALPFNSYEDAVKVSSVTMEAWCCFALTLHAAGSPASTALSGTQTDRSACASLSTHPRPPLLPHPIPPHTIPPQGPSGPGPD